jgi:TDG/mug DNA glycosylase family protein
MEATMRPVDEVVKEIVQRFKQRGVAQVPGYNAFGYVRETANAVIVSREAGKDTTIPFSKIATGVEAVRIDSSVYGGGPSTLRKHGMTHVNSPVWALLHMLSLEELRR